ncbi:hypothetical protein [Ottowia testudinis]|uniref:Uncharacterized protein n=1 Tax=Ottowia testudinis TaxID=2816950 RepID=A0A975H3S5_9BURK|nr:hypothetical protein [Ottowia testudinis]QTD46188.1 hypothetical protein J1M35_04590 [Ottowia testudinis]
MRKTTIAALAVLLVAASGVEARGARFKGSRGGSSHSAPHAESSGGGVHLPAVRSRGNNSNGEDAGSGAAPGAASATDSRALQDRLNAELAAQRAATPPGAPVGTLSAVPKAVEPAPLAPNEQRVTKRTPVEKAAVVAPMPPADVTALVPKDSAKKDNFDAQRRQDRFNARGVNCSLYPARCG